jgi:GNAT superfamily N-acetyltransferase
MEMLADSPLAFGETLPEAQSRTAEEWQDLVAQLITRPIRTAFLASDEQGSCGFVCVDSAWAEAPPNTVVVSRLWVAPRQRGTGLGRRLMEVVTEWATQKHAGLLGLGVTEMNTSALQFYEHLGYTDTGMRFPWPPDPSKHIIILGRPLS